MPTPAFRVRHVVPALLGAVLLATSFASLAEAKTKSKPAGLRVVSSSGKSFAQGTQFTAPTEIKTSKDADCFGPGTGGSGQKVDLPGFTALGQLADGPAAFPKLDPISVTDAFSFGLGLCGIGDDVAPSTGFWYLKVNHAASMAGGDQTTVGKSDEVLWYLIEDFNDPTPDELELKVPSGSAGEKVTAKVVSYADDGTKSAAAGATIKGVDQVTDSEGEVKITLGSGVTTYRATRAGSIPSNSVTVCADKAKDCAPGYARTIGGTKKADSITGAGEAEAIFAGPGNDEVDARKGNALDKINCGPGEDELILAKGSKSPSKSCEKVKFK